LHQVGTSRHFHYSKDLINHDGETPDERRS